VLALWALVNAMNLLLLVPATDRASGALETLRATRLRPIQIAQAWWLLAAGFSMYIILTSGLGYLLASFAGFSMPVHAGILALPLFVAPTIALGVRVQARSHDLRASTFILVPYTYGALLLFGLAAWAHPLPLVAAAIPIGGALLFSLGGLPAFTLPVVVLASVGSTQAWLRSTANILEEDSDRVAGRHARRTHYTGAVLWLAAVASGANLLMQSHMALNDWPITVMTMSIVLCIGLPGALTPWLFGLSPRSVLQLGAPRPINWLLLPMLLCGTVGGGFLAMQGLLAWYPVDMRYLEEFSEVMAPMMSPLGIVLGSVIPGVCEELLFRGAMLGLLRRSGRIWGPIVLQAVLFAVFHAHFARLPPTFFIGLFLGVLAWRTGSIWPGVVVHTLHNAILIGASTYLVLEPAPPVDTTPYLVGMVLLGGLGLFLARGRPGISKE